MSDKIFKLYIVLSLFLIIFFSILNYFFPVNRYQFIERAGKQLPIRYLVDTNTGTIYWQNYDAAKCQKASFSPSKKELK